MDIATRLANLLFEHRTAWLGPSLGPMWKQAADASETLSMTPEPGSSKWDRVVIFSQADSIRAAELVSEDGLILLISEIDAAPAISPDFTIIGQWRMASMSLTCFCRTKALGRTIANGVRPLPIARAWRRWMGRIAAIFRAGGLRHPLRAMRKMKRLAMIEREIMREPAFYAAQLRGLTGEIDFAAHFLAFGAAWRLNPSPFFDSIAYYHANPDVAHAGANALIHYLEHGKAEGRLAVPVSAERKRSGFHPRGNDLLRKTRLDIVRKETWRLSSALETVPDTASALPRLSVVVTGAERRDDARRTVAGLRMISGDHSIEVILTETKRENLASAIERGKCNHVVVLSAGIVPARGCLAALIERLGQGQSVVTGRVLDHRGALLDVGGVAWGKFVTPIVQRFGEPESDRLSCFGPATTVPRAFFAFDRAQVNHWDLLVGEGFATGHDAIATGCYEPRAIAVSCTNSARVHRSAEIRLATSQHSAICAANPVLVVARRFKRPDGSAANGSIAGFLADLRREGIGVVAGGLSPLASDADRLWLGEHGIAFRPLHFESDIAAFAVEWRRTFSDVITLETLSPHMRSVLTSTHLMDCAPRALSEDELSKVMLDTLPLTQHRSPPQRGKTHRRAIWIEPKDSALLAAALNLLSARQGGDAMPQFMLFGSGADILSQLNPDVRKNCRVLGLTAHSASMLTDGRSLAIVVDSGHWMRSIALAEHVPVLTLPRTAPEVLAQMLLDFEREPAQTSAARDAAKLTSSADTAARLALLGISVRDKPIESASAACYPH